MHVADYLVHFSNILMLVALPVHPVQLYSTVLGLAATVYLVRSFLRRRYDGEGFCRFLVAYGISRLVIIPFRSDALASMKAFSVMFIIAGVAGLLSMRSARFSALGVATP